MYPFICKVFSDGRNFKRGTIYQLPAQKNALKKCAARLSGLEIKKYREKLDEGPWTAPFNSEGSLNNYDADGSELVTFKSAYIR